MSTIEAHKVAKLERKTMLKLENVSKVYYGKSHVSSSEDNNDSRLFLERVVLNNLNLSIGEGEFITIVGRSGCEKSTLLNIVSGVDRSYICGKPISQSTNTDRIVIFQEAALCHGSQFMRTSNLD